MYIGKGEIDRRRESNGSVRNRPVRKMRLNFDICDLGL